MTNGGVTNGGVIQGGVREVGVKEGLNREVRKVKENGGGRLKEGVIFKQTKKSNSLRREPALKPKENIFIYMIEFKRCSKY